MGMPRILPKPFLYLFGCLVLFAGYFVASSYSSVRADDHNNTQNANIASNAKKTKEAEEREASPILLWQDLTEGNRRFMRGAMEPKSVLARRVTLAKGQHPKIAVLGCADSRVAPELVFDKNLGDLFVVRTAGNIADPIALGSLEYAVEHLHVKTLLVLGHEKCGAVAAAATGAQMPTVNLAAIVNKITPALKKVESTNDAAELAMRQVIANIHNSASLLIDESPILKHAAESQELNIVKAVYQLETGEVKRLQ